MSEYDEKEIGLYLPENYKKNLFEIDGRQISGRTLKLLLRHVDGVFFVKDSKSGYPVKDSETLDYLLVMLFSNQQEEQFFQALDEYFEDEP